MASLWGEPRPVWWLLPRKEWDRNRWLTWRDGGQWWSLTAWHYLFGPFFRTVCWLGIWDTDVEGGYYVEGHLCWPWRSRSVQARWRWKWQPWVARQLRLAGWLGLVACLAVADGWANLKERWGRA